MGPCFSFVSVSSSSPQEQIALCTIQMKARIQSASAAFNSLTTSFLLLPTNVSHNILCCNVSRYSEPESSTLCFFRLAPGCSWSSGSAAGAGGPSFLPAVATPPSTPCSFPGPASFAPETAFDAACSS